MYTYNYVSLYKLCKYICTCVGLHIDQYNMTANKYKLYLDSLCTNIYLII